MEYKHQSKVAGNKLLAKTFAVKFYTLMKTKNFLLTLLSGFILFSSCKKQDVQSTTTPPAIKVNADGSLNIADADGAFYTVVTKDFTTNNSTTFDESHMAYAWAGKFPAVVDAGIVKANNIVINKYGPYYMSLAVLQTGDTLFKGVNCNTVWNVQGNSSSGVAAFTYTDNTTMPAAPTFTLPASININNNLTISHASTGGTLGVLYMLSGDNGDTTKYIANTSSTVTFTSAEIKSVAKSQSAISIAIMPVTYTTSTIGGKKYYFVKQNEYVRETATL